MMLAAIEWHSVFFMFFAMIACAFPVDSDNDYAHIPLMRP